MHYHTARSRATYELGKKRGWDVKIYVGKHDKKIFAKNDVPLDIDPESVRFINVTSDKASSYNNGNVVRQTKQLLNIDSPDAVAILGYNTWMDWASLKWCRQNNKGAILLSESQSIDFQRTYWREQIKKVIISLFDAALVGGRPQLQYVKTLGLSQKRIFTGYDAVDNDFWANLSDSAHQNPKYWRQQYNLPENFFLSACRLVPKKNVDGLLIAYARYFFQNKSPWPLVIIGDGLQRNELEDLAKNLGVAQHVRFMGYLNPEQMGIIYGLATVFILASAYSEQWGLVVNEAMSSGLPVLVSKICGCADDLVINGVTGFTFDPADNVELSNLMKKCTFGEFDLPRLGLAAQAHIGAYSPQNFAENLLTAAEVAIDHAQKRPKLFWL